MKRLVFLVAILAIVLAGCSGSGGATPHKGAGGTSTVDDLTGTSWLKVLDQVQADGSVSTATALAAFSLAIAPLSGVATPPGKPTQPESGTIAIDWVFQHWGDLTAAQRREVLSDIGAHEVGAAASPGSSASPADFSVHPASFAPASFGTAAPPPNPNLACLTSDVGNVSVFRNDLGGILNDFVTHFGSVLTLDVHFAMNTQNLEGAEMYTWACEGGNVASGKVTGCTIHVNPDAMRRVFSDDDRLTWEIHELAHCFLFNQLGIGYAFMPAWYVEGAPMWIQTRLGPASDPKSAFWWTLWLASPTMPLFQRTDDGIGFFVHLSETGTDVWKAIVPIGQALAANGNSGPAAWAAAAPTGRFLDTFGSSYVTGRYPGAAWDTGGPNLPHFDPALAHQPLTNTSAPTAVSSVRAAANVAWLDISAEVVNVIPSPGSSGRFSLGDGSDTTLDVAAGNTYCTIPAGCRCPSTSANANVTFTQLPAGQHYVSVTGGLSPASVEVAGTSLDEFCKRNTPCMVGDWVGVGTALNIAGSFDVEGGAGTKLHIAPNGDWTLNYDGSEPLLTTGLGKVFGGVNFQEAYTGTETANMVLPPPRAHSGTWSLTRLDINGVYVSFGDGSTMSGPLSVGQMASLLGISGEVSGNGGMMSAGTWTCVGSSLTISPPSNNGASGEWTWSRTGG